MAQTTRYLSDLTFQEVSNGWGPAERDRSNGETGPADGRTLTLQGKVYAKGLGVHANSEIRYQTGGRCSTFSASVGVDDEVGDGGSVVLQVWGDNVKLFDSGTMRGKSQTRIATASLTGKSVLRLVVTDAGDGNGSDHADWADARITCTDTATTDTQPPTVTAVNPAAGAAGVVSSASASVTFSESMNASTITASTFTLVRQGTTSAVPAAVSYDASTNTATLRPSAAMDPGLMYTATVKGGAYGVKDAAGNALSADRIWAFTVAGTSSTQARFLSDMTPASSINSWGPYERDMSNGEDRSGDGRVITIAGRQWTKGLGVHAISDLRYNLAGGCTTFTASVGVDDESAGTNATVVFQVWADGTKLYESGVMRPGMAAAPVSVNVQNRNEIALIANDAGDGIGSDHADWADAKVSCGADTTPPSVISTTPTSGATAVATGAPITATFSEGMDAATLTANTVWLRPQTSSTPLAGSVAYNATNRTVTITPSAALSAGTTYVGTVKAGVKDTAGNALPSDKVWAFTTAAAAPVTPPPPSSTRTVSGPIVIDGRSDVVISNMAISNPNGHCIEVRNNSRNIVIDNSEIGPCGHHGVYFMGGSNVTVKNSYIHDAKGLGIAVEFADQVMITDNRIERVASGVYASRSTRLVVEFNQMLNMMGPHPAGAFVQYSEVNGGGNRIRCNVGENIMGQSVPEDAINIYASKGTSTDPIQVVGNKIRGGGPSISGGGINLADTDGAYIVARENILVDPGQYGIAISGGNYIQIQNNLVYGRQQSFTNVGITAWVAYPGIPCSNVSITGNSVNWMNSAGDAAHAWTDGKCGAIDWSTNTFGPVIDATIFNRSIAACVR